MKIKDFDSKKIFETGLGGINRSKPAADVNYSKVLNTVTDTWKGNKVQVTELTAAKKLDWADKTVRYRDAETGKAAKTGHVPPEVEKKVGDRAEKAMRIKNKYSAPTNEEQLNELSVDKLKKYVTDVENMDPATTPKFKMVKHDEGHAKAKHRIARMTGDRSSKMYESRLEEILEAFDANAFADILSKQDQEKQAVKPRGKVIPIEFHGWTIKYRNEQPSEWMILDKKGEIKQKGESATPKDAVADAEAFITGGGGTKQQASSNVTIDFNVDFAKQFAPSGETFYATIDQDEGMPMLIFSTMPEQGLKTSHIRTQASKVTSGTTKLPMISMSPSESNKMGLQPNGRYILGSKIPVDDNTAMFPLIYQGTVQGKGDMMKLGKPGLTVAHTRD